MGQKVNPVSYRLQISKDCLPNGLPEILTSKNG